MSSFADDSDFPDRMPLSAQAVAARPAPYLDELNPAQREAVEALDGPVLMLAGAGTGKTKALTTRIAHLLVTGKARPNEILAVTFTNKAAREMKNRVAGHLGQTIERMPWLGTFHAICVKLLRRHAELIGTETISGLKPDGGVENDAVLLDESEGGQGAYDLGPTPRPGVQATTQANDRSHLKSNFTILDTDDQVRLMKQLIVAEGIDEKRWPARQLAHIIDGWKNRALTPDKVPAADHGAFNHRGVELYAAYQQRLLTLNAVDFGDLLLHVVWIFQNHNDVLEQYQRWFKYILVDEYQDTNVAQYLWLRLLAQSHKNICCVGDDDQSIYGWRGAEVGNILKFEKDFPGAKVIRLEQNYRSTPHILAAASGVITANQGRLGKTLFTEAEEGWKVKLIGHWDGDEEARWIGEKIESLADGSASEAIYRQNPRSKTNSQEAERLSKGGIVSQNSDGDIHQVNLSRANSLSPNGVGNNPVPRKFELDEIAILVRASHQMRAFEDRFLTIGLPYRVIGGPRFYERMEIRDAMAYFRLSVSPDDDLAFERIVNTPKRGLGDVAQKKIQTAARTNGVSLVEGARLLLAAKGLGGKGAKELAKLVEGLSRWHSIVRAGQNHLELAEQILDESGYTEMWQNDKTPEGPGRLENLKELVKALESFENLQGFLEHVSLIMDNESEDGEAKVSIMTLHAAKGLEFPAVFLPGWEDGLFPSQRSMDESGLKGLEEERRLAYVGITRAEEIATISFAGNRRVYGQWQSQMPSRFIDELPADHVEVLTPPGLYGGAFGAAAAPDMAGAPKSDLHDQAAHAGLEGDKLDIAFNKAGDKKVVAKFVTAAATAGDDVPF